MIAPKVTERIAAKLDASPVVIQDWRRFLHFFSVWPSIGGFLWALGVAIGTASGAIEFRHLVTIRWTWIIVAVAFLASLIGRLIDQSPPRDKDDDDDNSEHA